MNKQYLYAYVEINIDMYTDMYINKLAKAMNEWVCVCVHLNVFIYTHPYTSLSTCTNSLNPKL